MNSEHYLSATLTSGGFAYVLSFSSQLLVDQSSPLPAVNFEFEGKRVHVNPPIRLGHRCWRPIPLLDAASAERLFQNSLSPLPLQIAVFPAIGEDGAVALTALSGRGGESDAALPPDTIIISVEGADENFNHAPLISEIINPMLLWVRVLTRQWWVGRGTSAQTGNAHFSFQFHENGKAGPLFAPLCSQSVPDKDLIPINSDIWIKAFQLAIGKSTPPWSDVLILDATYYRSNREYLSATILTCGWAETERNNTLEYHGIRISDLKVGSTDLLKHVSLGFEKALSRNLAKDLPLDFSFLKSLWISRGEAAHGKPFRWEFSGEREMAHYQAFGDHLNRISDWFSSLRRL